MIECHYRTKIKWPSIVTDLMVQASVSDRAWLPELTPSHYTITPSSGG
ncbi:hypothetical protein TNCT_718531, partial [Trichonephila clavata]